MDLAVVFAEVAVLGSFTRAADRLGSSKAQVSKQVAELERALGTQLLLRTTRRLALTEAGRVFLDYAKQIRDIAHEAERAVTALREGVEGRLRITAPTSFGESFLPELLIAFQRKYPRVTVELDLSIARRDLVADGYDFGLRNARTVEETLVARPLGRIRELPLASPAFVARHGPFDAPASLANAPALVNSHFGDDEHWLFEHDGALAPVRVSGAFRVNSYSAIKRTALAGAGIARLPRYLVADELASGALLRIVPGHELVATPLWLVAPHRRIVPHKNRVFGDFVVDWFEQPERRALFA